MRFLPLVLRYSPEDQVLDEAFVISALQDLREQVRIFETKMVAERAFALAPKLDKLAFIQNQLPKVFSLITTRIYPQFELWNEAAVRSKAQELLVYLAPQTKVDINAVPLELTPGRSTPTVVPRLSELPVIVWKTAIGCQAWKNAPISIGNDVIVASSGQHWNQPDGMDGIYCLHAETGSVRWFVQTPSDANQVMISKGLVFAGCDDGTVVAVRLLDGARQWIVKLDSAIVGGPLRLPTDLGMGLRSSGSDPSHSRLEAALVVTYNGGLSILDQASGRQVFCT